MPPPDRIGKRPGRTPSLTRDDVARAALESGLESLSMPTVARRLGVRHSTLYGYVHDRDDLLLAAVELAVREFDWPQADQGWRELLTGFGDTMWAFLKRHPGIAEAIQGLPGMPPRVAELMTEYTAGLHAAGLTRRDALVALDFVADLAVATEISMRGLDRVYSTAKGERTQRELYLDAWPAVVSGDATLPGAETFHGRGWFDDKLALLLDGLAGRIAK